MLEGDKYGGGGKEPGRGNGMGGMENVAVLN